MLYHALIVASFVYFFIPLTLKHESVKLLSHINLIQGKYSLWCIIARSYSRTK